ncbi:MAG TPA: endonuclease domain-containing protein [Saprospiraceae bacterium]
MLHLHEINKHYHKVLLFARKMRRNPTAAEEFFWEKVRNRKLFGTKWNRQFIIECQIDSTQIKYYIADFHCHHKKLIVELDGQIHLNQIEEDLIRTENMNQFGYTVLRFTNEQVLNHWDEVEEILARYIKMGRESSHIR